VLALQIEEWREVDQQLRTIAQRRAALDAEEARWLRKAEDLELWREVGMVSALDYLERVLGYAPHAGAERLRVARALANLPAIECALESGQLCFSAVRELTRVATPQTEDLWRARAVGKNVRQVEELVAGHAPGSLPDDPPDPAVTKHVVRWEIDADAFAQLRQTQTALSEEHGRHLDHSDFVRALCDRALDRAPGDAPSGRAKFQLLLTVCKQCERGTQEASGIQVPVDAATIERAQCDAQHIGATTDTSPARAEQDVPPKVRRFVWRRDGGRCQTPGCRSARGLEVHHIVRRADGGSHDASNLRLQCSACHSAIHRNTLEIVDGEARRPAVEPDSVPRGTDFDAAACRVQARDALVGLGWKRSIASAAVDDAISALGPAAPLDTLIREALRRCPRPSS
jgi:hypothetical protein